MNVGAADPEEYAEIYEIVNKAFKQSNLEDNIINITLNKDPNFKRGDLRVARIDGKIVSMMMLIRRPLRVGTAIVDGAIVAPVATHPSHQRKGYCSLVMKDAVKYMKTQDLDLTILWGNPWLYPHYGYSPAMMKTEIVIAHKQGSQLKREPCKITRFTETHLEQITRIYHKNTMTRTCAEIRSPTMWEWKPGGPEAQLDVLINKKGEVIGYVAFGTDWGRPCAHEIGVLNDEASKMVFSAILEKVKRENFKEFYCIIHPDHPFARFAFWSDSMIRIGSGGGAGMARVLKLVSLLIKMKKEFERRLHHSEFRNLECSLRVTSKGETAVIHIDNGQVSVEANHTHTDYKLDIPLSSLNPLITGYKGIDELIKNSHVKVDGEKSALRLIQVLFPNDFPYGGLIPIVWE